MPQALFITARFRTGSTVLWHIFRQVPEATAYYEPLNERLLKLIDAQVKPHSSHIGVEDYFGEYRALPELGRHYQDEFGVHRLWLNASDRHPALIDYLQYLIDCAGAGRTAVLQCNRIDFRLPWIKAHFPQAPIVHLHRSPRDQWVSVITASPVGATVDRDIDADPYALTTWARDLAVDFPFLSADFIRHPYQRFYYLWKLSYLAGKRFADLSISFEDDLLAEPRATTIRLLQLAQLDAHRYLDACLGTIVQRPTQLWRAYRSDDWFTALEQECDEVLNAIDLEQWFAGRSIAQDAAVRSSFPMSTALKWLQRASQLAILKLDSLEASLTAKLAEVETYNNSLQETLKQRDAEVDGAKRLVASLQGLLKERDAEIGNAQQYIASLQDILTKREHSLSEAEQYVQSLRELLKHRDAEISSAHQYIASLQGFLKERDAEIGNAQQYIASLQDILTKREHSLSEAEQYTPSLKSALAAPSQPNLSATSPAICTIVSKNYLAHARCLVDSFLEHNPDGQAFVLLVDRVDGYFDPAQERFITVLANDLEIPNFQWFSFRYTIMELNTAVKPFFLEYLFKRFGLQKLCYFDPDILIYGKLDGLSSTLDEFGIVLTPHLLGFLDDEHNPNELSILLSGAYNLGFIGLSQHNDLETFLHWWQRKLLKYCTADVKNGLFVDQRWIDLVPSIFASVYILRDPGYNVAYWNLYCRHVEPSNGSYRVNGSLLRFFHFSGFSPDSLHTVSKHQNRFTLEDIGESKALFLDYSERLLRSDYRAIRQWPYAYGAFDDGAPIPDLARWLYRETDAEGQRWPNPFATVEPDSFRNWLNEPADETGSARPVLTRLAMYVYYRRADLQQAFPDVLKEDRLAYANWFVMSGKEQHGIHDVFLEPIKESLELAVAEAAERKPQLSYPSLISLGTHWVLRVNYSRFGRLIKRLVGQKMVARLKRLFFNAYRTLFGATIKKAPSVSPSLPDSIVASRPTLSPGANVIGYIRSETGVGEAARSTLRSLRYHNFPVAYTNIVKHDLARKEDDSCADVPEGHPYDINLLHVNADQVMAVHDELGPEFFAGKYNIGFWFWEMASLPEIWHDRFGLFKEIWVASTYTQAAVAAVSPIPVIRMRPSIEVRHIAEGGRQALGLPEDKFVFLFAFDLFSICERKNPFGLIEAFRRAFGDNHPEAALVIKVNNFHRVAGLEAAAGIEKGLQQKVMDAVQSVSGMLLDEEMDRDRVNALYRACDCFVSLHRSEGFGLSLAEAMCLGKPCVATAYSSNIDFMTAANSYLVNYRLVELERDYGPYKRGSVWADPDIDHAATLMRHVFENSDEAASRGAVAAEDIRRFYSPAVVGREMIGRLTLIAKDHWAA